MTHAELCARHNAGESFDYLFFWGHKSKAGGHISRQCLSQWFDSPFAMDGLRYLTAEHYMMAEKARLFNDRQSLEKILNADNPGAVKALGRGVRGFDESTWNEHRFDIVLRGNLAKFSQNPALKHYLMTTATKVLVEASPYDTVWGIGMSEHDDDVRNPNCWRGINLLGFAIMEARSRLCGG